MITKICLTFCMLIVASYSLFADICIMETVTVSALRGRIYYLWDEGDWGKPASGFTVTLSNEDYTKELQSVEADDDGYFTVPTPVTGTYLLRFKSEAASDMVEVNIIPNSPNKWLDVKLGLATFIGCPLKEITPKPKEETHVSSLDLERNPDGELSFEQLSSLPSWIYPNFKQDDPENQYILSSRLNPFYLHGDFDGDTRLDVAIWVKNRETNKVGIAIVHRNSRETFLIGVGNPILNGSGEVLWPNSEDGDSLTFIDAWSVYEKGSVGQGVGEGPPPTLKGDALLLIKTESASGLIYWTGKHYAWYQQGD